MAGLNLAFSATPWLYHGKGAWCFVTLPADAAQRIKFVCTRRNGFGSIRVNVSIGTTTWQTSIFPDKGSGSFLLPLKAEMRRRENVVPGNPVEVSLTIGDTDEI